MLTDRSFSGAISGDDRQVMGKTDIVLINAQAPAEAIAEIAWHVAQLLQPQRCAAPPLVHS